MCLELNVFLLFFWCHLAFTNKSKQPCSCFACPVSFAHKIFIKVCFMIITTCVITPILLWIMSLFSPHSQKKWPRSTHACIIRLLSGENAQEFFYPFNFPWRIPGTALIFSIQSAANHPPPSTMASRCTSLLLPLVQCCMWLTPRCPSDWHKATGEILSKSSQIVRERVLFGGKIPLFSSPRELAAPVSSLTLLWWRK